MRTVRVMEGEAIPSELAFIEWPRTKQSKATLLTGERVRVAWGCCVCRHYFSSYRRVGSHIVRATGGAWGGNARWPEARHHSRRARRRQRRAVR